MMEKKAPFLNRSEPLVAHYPLVSGRAEFLDDRSLGAHEVFVGILGAPCAKGKLVSVSYDLAKMEELLAVCFTAKDMPLHKKLGPIKADQPLLVAEDIRYFGEPVAIVATAKEENLPAAKDLIKVKVVEEKPILTIEQAIEQKSFLAEEVSIEKEGGSPSTRHRLKGTFKSHGQDHFYLESQTSIAYPKEDSHIEIHSSTQHPTELQHWVADFLGIGYHKVSCVVKRMGGGFGGKESQSNLFGVMAAFVANKLSCPARLVLTKDQDMAITGGRHPMKTDYEVSFDEQGAISFLKAKIWSDGGAYLDLSPAVLDRALLHVDGCYFLPGVSIKGQVLKTNLPPNTAFRGFGGPQGTAVMENIMEEIAYYLKMDPLKVRQKNLYRGKKCVTHYGQKIEGNHLPHIFKELSKTYKKLREETSKFNRENPHKVRGLALTGTKFGIAFTNLMMNQGNAKVMVQLDGSVQVATGATEMGQGVLTKIAQIVAGAFYIPLNKVSVLETRTDQNPNTSPTAASSGTDINGGAALQAANSLLRRLAHLARAYFKTKDMAALDLECNVMPKSWPSGIFFDEGGFSNKLGDKISFLDTLKLAYQNRVSLAEFSHYKTPHINGKGERKFNYFTNGAACSLVEVDLFTGQYKVLKTKILMDLGRPINPAIDEGQVRGGFIQAQGWVTTESLFRDGSGELKSHSPTTYKIPGINDIPLEFEVQFLDTPHKKGVAGSKAVGEPPFLLGLSVFFAIKNALYCKMEKSPQLSIPATCEAVLMALKSLKK